MTVIFGFKECNLFINSNYLVESVNPDYQQLTTMIHRKRHNKKWYSIEDTDFDNQDMVTKLIKQKANIIAYCREEWTYNVKKQPFVKQTKDTHVCELCGYRYVKEIHYAINKLNGGRLTIGKDCAQVMLNSTLTYGTVFADNPEAYERYVTMLNNISFLETIMQRKKEKYYQFPQFPIVLPKTYHSQTNTNMKNIADRVEDLAKLITLDIEATYSDRELLDNIRKFKANDADLVRFYNDKKNNFYYLRSSQLRQLNLHKRDNDKIVKLVENNGGKLTSAAASHFRQKKFLKKFQNNFNNNIVNVKENTIEFSIEEIINGNEPYFLLDLMSSNFQLLITTKNFINDIGDIVFDRKNANVDFKSYMLESLNKFEVPIDYINRVEIAGLNIVEQKLNMQYDSNILEKRLEKYDNQNQDDLTSVILKVQASYHLFRKINSSEMLLIRKKHIKDLGIIAKLELADKNFIWSITSESINFKNIQELDNYIHNQTDNTMGLASQDAFI